MKTTIINMLYDIPFKKVMQIPQHAELFLSRILKQKVVLERFDSQETMIKYSSSNYINRLDFVATITDKNGKKKKVLIEMQKGGNEEEMYRFRHYLACQMIKKELNINAGETYKNLSTTDLSNDFAQIEEQNRKLRTDYQEIICIYLLNFKIGIDEAVFRTPDSLENLLSGENCTQNIEDSAFLRLLTNKIYVVQIPLLRKQIDQFLAGSENLAQETKDLITLLDFFSDLGGRSNKFKVEVETENFDTGMQEIMNTLSYLTQDIEIQRQMDEQDFFDERIEREFKRGLELSAQQLKESKQREKESKQREEESKQEKEEEQRKRVEAEQKAKLKDIKLAKRMLQDGESIEMILQDTDLSEEEISIL